MLLPILMKQCGGKDCVGIIIICSVSSWLHLSTRLVQRYIVPPFRSCCTAFPHYFILFIFHLTYIDDSRTAFVPNQIYQAIARSLKSHLSLIFALSVMVYCIIGPRHFFLSQIPPNPLESCAFVPSLYPHLRTPFGFPSWSTLFPSP